MSEEMEDLVKQYAENLPIKIHEIENQWYKLQENWNIDGFSDFHLKVHSLCGSTGLYGYHEISEIANQLQMYLLLLSKEDASNISKEQKDKIIDFLNRLKEAAVLSVEA